MTAKNKRNPSPFKEYLRFGTTGVLNTGTDFVVLNLLIASFGPSLAAASYVSFKIVSFCAALIQSYFLNKHWVFAAGGAKAPLISEGGKFAAVSALGFVINIASSSLVFAALSSLGVESRLAANIGAMTGTLLVMVWNYAGYKHFVFKSTKSA